MITKELDGYEFADRLLEGVVFDVEIDEEAQRIESIEVQDQHADYFSQFNEKQMYERAHKAAESRLPEWIPEIEDPREPRPVNTQGTNGLAGLFGGLLTDEAKEELRDRRDDPNMPSVLKRIADDLD